MGLFSGCGRPGPRGDVSRRGCSVEASEQGDAPTQFLLQEYSNIAQAQFKTIDTMSSFFENYLLIMSVPVTVALLPLSSLNIDDIRTFGAIALALISLVGLLVLFYVANLRMDATLYARTINALRKHFYDRLPGDFSSGLATRVLPQTHTQPPYHERFYFGPVAGAFAAIDAGYAVVAGAVTINHLNRLRSGWRC